MRFLLLAMIAAAALAATATVRANPVVTEHAVATLVSDAEAIAPGRPFWVAVHLELEEGWHVYWKNPGDSGLAPEIAWKIPGGFAMEEIRWPPPGIIRIGDLVNYGYENEAWLLAQVTPPGYINESYTFIITAEASWLACHDICVPESATLSLPLKATGAGEAVPGVHADRIAVLVAGLPKPLPAAGVYGGREKQALLSLAVPGIDGRTIDRARFFPVQQGVIDNRAEQHLQLDGERLRLSINRGALKLPERLEGVLSLYGHTKSAWRQDYYVTLDLGVVKEHKEASGMDGGLWQALLFALLGGIILNAMPCVFPVLSLKALSVAKQAAHDPARVKWQGIAYTAGVLLCFAALSGVLIALRQGGAQIGWGFQLQSPPFVAAMAYLFFAVGLSLSGVFHLPVLLGGAAGKLTGREGISGSFFTGMLAALVATPCTAPFMAPAIGFALIQPAAAAVGIFLALGLGLSLPYLLISLFPPALQLLPRPGAWMERFKQFLAFPMYASSAWLLWVLTQQAGSAGLAYALAGIVLLAFCIWLMAHIRPGRLSRWAVLAAALPLLAGTLYVQTPREKAAEGLPPETQSSKQPFSMSRLESLRAQGRAVFVNATADWCITCKANERLALHSELLWQAFKEKDIAYLEADWTSRDPEIAAYLRSFGRSGVPLYVYYPPGRGEPVVLPQILLGPSAVLDVIAAPGGRSK